MNLVDLLLALVSRDLEDCRVWVPDILFSVSIVLRLCFMEVSVADDDDIAQDEEFVRSKASKEDKERFAKAVLSWVPHLLLAPLFGRR